MAQTELFQQGLVELKAGHFVEARRIFAENEEKTGTSKESKQLLREAEAHLASGEVDLGAEKLNTVLERNPTLYEVYVGLARVAIFTGQLADARTHAMGAVKVAPQVGLAWTTLGLVHEADGDPEGALPHLQKGAQLDPNNFLCQYNYGRLLVSEKRASEGISFLIRAMAPIERPSRIIGTASTVRKPFLACSSRMSVYSVARSGTMSSTCTVRRSIEARPTTELRLSDSSAPNESRP